MDSILNNDDGRRVNFTFDSHTKSTPQPYIYIYQCKETDQGEYIKNLRADIKKQFPKHHDLFLDYPVVYIHTWTAAKKTFKDEDDVQYYNVNDMESLLSAVESIKGR